MLHQERRQKSPEAIRMRSLVERCVDDQREAMQILDASDTPWMVRARALGFDAEVTGAAWLHKGPAHLWPAVLVIVRRGDGISRVVCMFPNENGTRWTVQVQPSDEIRWEQVFYEPGGVRARPVRPTPAAHSGYRASAS